MARPLILIPVLFSAVLIAAGCDDTPAGPSNLPPQVSARTITIGGLGPLQQPGDVLQLMASATFSDGSTRDVTSDATWRSSNGGVASFIQAGRLVAHAYGETVISATLQSVQARADLRVAPSGMFLIRGRVTEGGSFAIVEATVSLIQSDGAVLSTRTNVAGSYTLVGAGAIVLRVEKDGFVAEEHGETINSDTEIDIDLERSAPPTGIQGIWELTFTASPACTALPVEFLRRQYTARIWERGRLEVELSGADMEAWGDAGFTGTRTGVSVTFFLVDDNYDDYIFIERVDPQRNLAFSGTALGTIADDTIEAVFNGRVQLRSVSGGPIHAECRAEDHRLTFVR